MKTYILIVVITGVFSGRGSTSITTEFESKKACELAIQKLQEDVKQSKVLLIASSGCYGKYEK